MMTEYPNGVASLPLHIDILF
uniref:Uncharacterized protein n=1 Tax=Tetranychus urticae TaxID=32264 RepID=T1KUP4_TETUR